MPACVPACVPACLRACLPACRAGIPWRGSSGWEAKCELPCTASDRELPYSLSRYAAAESSLSFRVTLTRSFIDSGTAVPPAWSRVRGWGAGEGSEGADIGVSEKAGANTGAELSGGSIA